MLHRPSGRGGVAESPPPAPYTARVFLPTSIDYPYMDRPWATIAIFGVCVLLLFTHVFEPDLPAGVALDPSDFAPHQLITNVFFHVGPIHLLGNMLFLYVFGRYVEARLGALKYVALFMLTSLAGDLVWLVVGPDNPVVGSSGAICGLIGFVLAVAPHNKLNMVLVFGGRWDLDTGFQIAVGWMIAWWIGWDLWHLVAGDVPGVAFLSHLSGYAAGFGLGFWVTRPELEGTHWYVEPPPKPGDRTQTKRLRQARATGSGGKGTEGAVHPQPSLRERLPLRIGLGRTEPAPSGDEGDTLREVCPHEVVVRALGPDTSPVGVIKLLMKHRGMAPEKAKVLVDGIAAGTDEVFGFETVEQAARFAEDGRRLDLELNLRTAPARP